LSDRGIPATNYATALLRLCPEDGGAVGFPVRAHSRDSGASLLRPPATSRLPRRRKGTRRRRRKKPKACEGRKEKELAEMETADLLDAYSDADTDTYPPTRYTPVWGSA